LGQKVLTNVGILAMEEERQTKRFVVEASTNFSSCNFAKLTAWDNDIVRKACTSLRISDLKLEIKQPKKKGRGSPMI